MPPLLKGNLVQFPRYGYNPQYVSTPPGFDQSQLYNSCIQQPISTLSTISSFTQALYAAVPNWNPYTPFMHGVSQPSFGALP